MGKDEALPKYKKLSDLYVKDPEGFEKVTNQIIEDFIKNSPPRYQLKLRLFQAKWNKRVKKGDTPHNRLALAKNMFFEHFHDIFQPSLRLLNELNKEKK